jgi:hypothetical protein
MYFDAACTKPILTAEKFTGSGPYNLSAFTGAQLGGVYKESKALFADISFSLGVGSGFSGLVTDALKGQRVVHNNISVGQVVSNTNNTITITDTSYTNGSGTAVVSAYTKLYTPTDFQLSGNVITMLAAVTGDDVIHAVPTDTLAMYFGGAVGAPVSKTATIYLKRTANFEYTLLQIASDDVSLVPYSEATENVTFTGGVGSGFSGLAVGALIGKAVNHEGKFRGIVVANTATTVTISTGFTSVDNVATGYHASATAEIYNIGTLSFSLDGSTFASVVHPADLVGTETVVPFYVKDTLNIPSVAINYPSNIIKISGTEYIA